jgi:hypothetical protein
LAAETEIVPERRTIYAPQMPQGLINSRQWKASLKETTNRS